MAHPARERRVHSRPARRAGAAVEVRSLRREPGRLSGRDVRRRARVRPESYVDKSRGAELKFATGHNTCVFIDRFPCSLLSDLSVSAMEVTGEQQQDVEHKPFKQRLDKAASPVTPEAATHAGSWKFPLCTGKKFPTVSCTCSSANWLPNIDGLFLNPRGSTIQVSCILCPVVGLSHSKLATACLCLQVCRKKASFRSSTINHLCFSFKNVSNIYGLASLGLVS
ncbi:uncharacterized protein LOC119140556 isoform X1 [Falco rusticolus]|uniref:uncharacterized protein LOC119140556 isoform X1 n=1 Tax=Falco rusticolus TaxID=120794 RepID=UPI00188680CB|nr:uncharacterized protein LOC119140556 isoform X1 [Falco rusticolus]